MVRCAVIGCGAAADELHVPALRAIPGVRIVAACDADASRARAFALRHEIPQIVEDFDSLLARVRDLDFVVIATPGYTHYRLAKAALNAGVHVFVEKPVAHRTAEACELASLARRQRLLACVGHSWRYRDPVLQALEAMKREQLGTVYQVKVSHHAGSLFHVSEPAWSWNDGLARTLLYEHAIHLLDLQVLFAGAPASLVGRRVIRDPHLRTVTQVHALVEHAGGAIAHVDVQAFSSTNYTQFEIYGTANDVLIRFFPHAFRLYSGRLNPLDELVHDLVRVRDFAWSTITSRFRRAAVPSRALPHYRLLSAFVGAIRDGAPSPVSIEDVLPTMQLLELLAQDVYA